MGCTTSASAVSSTKTSRASSKVLTFFDQYKLGGKLGKGGFAQVRVVRLIKDMTPLAVKIMDLRDNHYGTPLQSKRSRAQAIEEAMVWQQAGEHQNVVKLHDAFIDHDVIFFVMEICDQQFQAYLKESCLDERFYSTVFEQLLTGLAHVHRQGVVHRDIKPDNVMVSKSVCKVCDFGLAATLPASGAGLTGIYGTAAFMAPEMLNREVYHEEVDVWSMGVMAYVLFFGEFPYTPEIKSSVEMKKKIREGTAPPLFHPRQATCRTLPAVSKEARDFVRLLLNRSKFERASAEDALTQPFLCSRDFSKLLSLNATFRYALLSGAFEYRPVGQYDDFLDPFLARLHWRKTRTVLEHNIAPEATKKHKSERSLGSSDASTGCPTGCPTASPSRPCSKAAVSGADTPESPIATSTATPTQARSPGDAHHPSFVDV